jgi:hypothetical protein
MARVIRRGGPSFTPMAYAADGTGATAGSGRSAGIAPVGSLAPAGSATDGSAGSKATPDSDQSATSTGAAGTPAAGASASESVLSASAAASALSAGALPGASLRAAGSETTVGSQAPVDLADAADRLMNQVVGTIHTYQTSAGPALEARINDSNLGDVRLIVTGRAGEIVQAQLIVRDRVTADAIDAAAGRMHSSGDALAGVSVSVRSEGGGSATGGRAGGSAFEAAGWAAGGGYGAGSGPGPNGGHSHGLANQDAAAAGNGTGGQPDTGDGSRGTPRPAPIAFPTAATPDRPTPRTPRSGVPSLDIRA